MWSRSTQETGMSSNSSILTLGPPVEVSFKKTLGGGQEKVKVMRLNLNPSKLAVKLLGWSNLVLEIHNLHYKWWTSNFLTALLTHLPFQIPTFPHDHHSQGDFWHEVLSTYLRALSGSSSQLVQWEISSAHPCRVSLDRGWLVEHAPRLETNIYISWWHGCFVFKNVFARNLQPL